MSGIFMLECIPNFSEGRNPVVIQAIAAAIEQVPGVRLLHTDAGAAANRTVFTFIGPPEAVVEAAFLSIAAAATHIDMRQQHGEHPRIGATDVCPLVPLADTTLEAAVQWANRLAERIGCELKIPVYLYEAAATRPERKNLATIRSGQYEGLAAKMQDPAWQPDYGPNTFNAKSGATVIGARPFLVAWNINLRTSDTKIAQSIAARLRESGYRKQDGTRVQGLFPHLKAIGWYMEEYGCAQVSTNVTNIDTINLGAVYATCRQLAQEAGTDVAGSELIGLIPLPALLQAGRYFEADASAREEALIRAAVEGLGLDSLKPFEVAERVLAF
jgi:glutamate formiminotransferase / formiminotetrahydrofolate cyclodeaminase